MEVQSTRLPLDTGRNRVVEGSAATAPRKLLDRAAATRAAGWRDSLRKRMLACADGASVLAAGTLLTVAFGVDASGATKEAAGRRLLCFRATPVRFVGDLDDSELELAPGDGESLGALLRDIPGVDRVDRLILASQTIDEPMIAELVALCRAER